MTRICCLLVFCLTLCGCGKTTDISPVLCGISFTASADYYNESYVLSVEAEEDLTLKMTVQEPQEIEGLTLFYEADEVSAEYMGLVYSPENSNSLLSSVCDVLNLVFNDINQNGYTAQNNDVGFAVTGTIEGSEYILSVSEAGLPISLEMPKNSLSVEFQRVTILK